MTDYRPHPTPPPPSARDYLGAHRVAIPPAARFAALGDTVSGRVAAVDVVEDLEYGTRRVRLDRDGRPVYVLRVSLITSAGARTLYVGGSSRAGSRSVRDAIATACREASVEVVEPGDWLEVRYAGDEPSSQPGFRDRKCYEARLRPAGAAARGGADPTPTPDPRH